MSLLEGSFRQAIDVNKAGDAAKAVSRTRHQFQHQFRRVSHRSRDVGKHQQVNVTGAARAKAQFREHAATLDSGANGAPEIDPAAAGEPEPAPQPNPEVAFEGLERFLRPLVFQIAVRAERRPLDFAKLRDSHSFEPGLFGLAEFPLRGGNGERRLKRAFAPGVLHALARRLRFGFGRFARFAGGAAAFPRRFVASLRLRPQAFSRLALSCAGGNLDPAMIRMLLAGFTARG